MSEIRSPVLCNAFINLCFQTMKSRFREGRYKNIPREQRLCICGDQAIEDTTHYVLYCKHYRIPRDKHLSRHLVLTANLTDIDKIVYLLSNTTKSIMLNLARFAAKAARIRGVLEGLDGA